MKAMADFKGFCSSSSYTKSTSKIVSKAFGEAYRAWQGLKDYSKALSEAATQALQKPFDGRRGQDLVPEAVEALVALPEHLLLPQKPSLL